MVQVYANSALDMSVNPLIKIAGLIKTSGAKHQIPDVFQTKSVFAISYQISKSKDARGEYYFENSSGKDLGKKKYSIPDFGSLTTPTGTVEKLWVSHYTTGDQYSTTDAFYDKLNLNIGSVVKAIFKHKYFVELFNHPGKSDKASHDLKVAKYVLDVNKKLTTIFADQFKGDDTIYGSAKSDMLYGFDGDDTLDGGKGSDRLVGGAHGAGGDWVSYLTSTGKVYVSLAETVARNESSKHYNVNKEWVQLNDGKATKGDVFDGVENLRGSVYDDTLIGDKHNNILAGSYGDDTLNGGGGVDTFAFTSLYDGTDTIKKFSVTEDKIRLDHTAFAWEDSRFDGAKPGHVETLRSQDFVSTVDGQPVDENSHIIYNQDTGELLYDPDGTDPAAAYVFAKVGAHLEGLTYQNFELSI